MNPLLQADIFFFITSIAVIVVTIALVVALFFLVQILRDVRYVSKRVREESDRVLEDVEHLRSFVVKEGKKAIDIKKLIGEVLNVFLPKRKSRRPKRKL